MRYLGVIIHYCDVFLHKKISDKILSRKTFIGTSVFLLKETQRNGKFIKCY